MRVGIVEDEKVSYQYLSKLICELEPDAKIHDFCPSVRSAVRMFEEEELDLIFMDIQLSDGLSFEIFSQINPKAPIIFTTAFDEYAVEAFKVNGIDYLLKHIEKEAIGLRRFHERNKEQMMANIQNLLVGQNSHSYKTRFLIKKGGGFRFIPVEQIAYLESDEGLTFLFTLDGHRHVYSKTIDQAIGELNPGSFFQINRGQVVSIENIREVHPHLNQRLKIIPLIGKETEFFVSRQRASEFKRWLDR